MFRRLDIVPRVQEALAQLAGVAKWAREKPAFSVNFFAMRPRVHKEPKGTVVIMSPFDYPVWLTLGPLVSARPPASAARVS